MLAQAQQIPCYPPLAPDEQAEPVGIAFQDVQHTGTDAVVYSGSNGHFGEVLQAMTWDFNGKVFLSWAFTDLNGGGPAFPANYKSWPQAPVQGNGARQSDPDVVMAYSRGELYANLVFVDGQQTRYDVYRWDDNSLSFNLTRTQMLGHPAYRHEYPNIDANALGLVAITWQQTIDDKVTVSVASNGSYFLPYTFEQKVTFGRTYVAGSTIEGDLQPCYSYQTFPGRLVKDPPTGLFEQTLHPDIAISEGDIKEAVISSTYLRHYVDGNGLFSIVNKLAVKQFNYLCRNETPSLPDTVGTHEWPYSYNDVLGTPRIAASFSDGQRGRNTGFEIVVDRTEPNCGTTKYAILNFGGSAGQYRPKPLLLSPPYAPTTESVEPVVAFVPTDAYYVVSWTGTDYDNSVGNGADVWAIFLKGGNYTNPGGSSGTLTQPEAYSMVNFNNDERQARPSVAARHLKATPSNGTPSVHLLADDNRQQLSFRYTDKQPGVMGGNLRPAAGTKATGLLQAYPNPTNETTHLTLRLQPGETLRQVLVLDVTGRQVADLTPPAPAAPASPPAQPGEPLHLTWNAAAAPAGSYVLRAVTTQRTATLFLTRK